MLIPFGFLASAGGAAGAYELIESQILTTTAASVTFASIPQTYKHLQIRAVASSNATIRYEQMYLRLNADTGSNYYSHNLFGNGTLVQSIDRGLGAQIWSGVASGGVAGIVITGQNIIDIVDYSASKNKTIRSLNGVVPDGSAYYVSLSSGLWMNTTAVTSTTLFPRTGTAWVAGSRFSLYGIKG